ncbi:hypothetical protein [Frankia sp. Cr1]|uniref:hypothetical protein n=1 Tax=Frankia sp. Cr1 TaxID=3073931 RepID=UPI002AD57E22|nr:hypothetical protein [Frankia sp. Cr1]
MDDSHRRAAEQSWAATVDRAGRTAPARAAALAVIDATADVTGVTDPGERERRIQVARADHFRRLRALPVRQPREPAAGIEHRPTPDAPPPQS